MKILRSLLAITLFFIVIYTLRVYIQPSLSNSNILSSIGIIHSTSTDVQNSTTSKAVTSSSSDKGITNNSIKGDYSPNRDKLPPIISSGKGRSDDSNLSSYGILVNTNNERKKIGLPELKSNYYLDKSAEIKLNDMFNNQYFEHTSPSGSSVSDLVNGVGYKFLVAGENLALGNFGGDPQVVEAWMASPGHRANILDNRYTEIGIAVGYGMYKGQKQWLAVQHFARPMSSCPSPNTVLKDQISKDKDDLISRETNITAMKMIVDKTESSDTNFQSIVSSYNALVIDYNSKLTNLKSEIATYNEQVRNFNTCLDSVTASVTD